jgi:hypothetical protein
MNCQEFWDYLPQRGHDITEAQAGHLAECAACKTQWAPHRALASGLHSMGEEWRQMEAPSRVEAGLMAAFRSQKAAPGRRAFARSRWTPVFAWASAAAATVALAVVITHSYQPAQVTPGTVAAPRHTAKPLVQVAVLTDNDSDDDSSVLGEGFVRLPNAPRIEANEDFNVVRVEVPGSAMIAMGVSMSEDRASENVVADVALASDGTARAVRLVPVDRSDDRPDGGTY